MLIQSEIEVTGITDGTEIVVMDEEDVIRRRLTSKRNGALPETATKTYPLDPAQAEIKAPRTACLLCLLPLFLLRRLMSYLNRPPRSFHP